MLRAYKLFADETYFESAKKAIDFMLIDLNEGGTSHYINDGLMLMEFTNQAAVLNGWIFAFRIGKHLEVGVGASFDPSA